MRTTATYMSIDDEIVAYIPANPTAAAAGMTGPGFGLASRSGTIASAQEQTAWIRRGSSAAIRSTLADVHQHAERESLVCAVIDRVLTIHGFTAHWSLAGSRFYPAQEGAADRIEQTNAEFACELTFNGTDDDLLVAATNVIDAVKAAAQALADSHEFAGCEMDLEKAIITSSAAAVSLKTNGGALSRLRREAQARLEKAAKAAVGIFEVLAPDLAICPICEVNVDKAADECSNGHLSPRMIRANQEAAIAQIVAQVVGKFAEDLHGEARIEAKCKGVGRVSMPEDFAELVGVMAAAASTVVKVDFSKAIETDPFKVLETTTLIAESLDDAYAAFGATEVAARSRVARATSIAVDKAADAAAEAIGFLVALEMHRAFGYIREAQIADLAIADRANAIDAVKAATGKELQRFAAAVNARGTLAPNDNRPAGRRNGKRVNPRNKRAQRTGSSRNR